MKSLSQEERLVLFGRLTINENKELQHVTRPVAPKGIVGLFTEFQQLSNNFVNLIKFFGALATRSKIPVTATTG